MLLNRLKTLIKEDPLREEIDLSNQAIYALDSNSVDLLSRFRNLKILNLSDNYISKIPLNLDLLKNLHSIDLNGNPISEIETAVDALKQVGPNLISL
jgi:Leucine-rich repeat (LRR) protein